MSVKRIFKTVFTMGVLVVLLAIGWHNRTPVEFSLLPVSPQTYHGPVAFMYFAFLGVGILLGMVLSIRTGRKKAPPIVIQSGPGTRAEPPVGSRIS